MEKIRDGVVASGTGRSAGRTVAVWLALASIGCSTLPGEEPGGVVAGADWQAVDLGTAEPSNAVDGLTTNGLTTNGLTTNGLTTNGLTTNGLATSGLTDAVLSGSAAFRSWFESNPPSYSDMVMRYVVGCALPKAQVRTFLSAGVAYTWPGNLGLAPGWAGGAPATEAEQQLVSACLAAHANRHGMQVPLSVQGRDATGGRIPLEPLELVVFSEQEACFFGNLFTGEGVYVGSDRNLSEQESTARACGLSSRAPGTAQVCAPMIHVGTCSSACTRDAAAKTAYARCQVNGKAYFALTTRLRPQDIYRCGDGQCQFTEHAGPGGTFDSCRADCGATATP
jgi:hypothetical protein